MLRRAEKKHFRRLELLSADYSDRSCPGRTGGFQYVAAVKVKRHHGCDFDYEDICMLSQTRKGPPADPVQVSEAPLYKFSMHAETQAHCGDICQLP